MRKITVFILLISLFLFGCLDENKKLYCCDLDELTINGHCVTPKGDVYDQVDLSPDSGTNIADGVVNVTIDYDIDGNPITDLLSVCSHQQSIECISGECTTLLCGQFDYTPNVPGVFDGDASVDLIQQNTQGGLYDGQCFFVPMDEKFQNVFNPDKKTAAYMGSLRIGVGDSYKEQKELQEFLPISDQFCRIYEDGTVDRFTNYLMSNSDFNNFLFGSGQPYSMDDIDPENPVELNDLPFLKTGNYGETQPSYVTTQVSRLSKSGDTLVSYEEIDREFYKKALTFQYWHEFIALDQKAPFECEGPSDCSSLFCNTEDYFRSVCYREDGGGGNCMCQEFTDEITGDTTHVVCRGVHDPWFSWDVSMQTNPDGPAQGFILNYPNIMTKTTLADDVRLPREICKNTINVRKDCGPSEDCSIEIIGTETECEDVESTSTYGNHIPADITFSNPGGVSGLSYIKPSEFSSSALASSCDLVAGVHYSTFNAEDILDDIKEKTKTTEDPTGWEPDQVPYFNAPETLPVHKTGSFVCSDVDSSDECILSVAKFEVYYPTSKIRINDLGSCVAKEKEQGFPEIRSFGWCESCTYSTLPNQELIEGVGFELDPDSGEFIQLNSSYSLGTERTCNNLGTCQSSPITTGPLADPTFRGEQSDFGKEYENTFGSYEGVGNSFVVRPDITYVQKLNKDYLHQDMLPILDVSNSTFWNFIDNLDSDFDPLAITNPSLEFTFGTNRGPITVVVASPTWNSTTQNITPSFEAIRNRVKYANSICDSCLISIYPKVSSPQTGLSRNVETYAILSRAFNKTGPIEYLAQTSCQDLNCDKSMLDNVTMIMADFYPNEHYQSLPPVFNTIGLCDPTKDYGMLKYDYIVEELSKLGISHLENFNKPTTIYHFNYTTGTCVESEQELKDSFSYILLNQQNLTSSGIVGLRYTGLNDGINDENFEIAESALRFLKEVPPNYIYTRTYALDESTCIPCNAADYITGDCNGDPNHDRACLNGNLCTLPGDASPDKDYRCLPDTIVGECTPCSASTNQLSCSLTSMIFDQQNINVGENELSDAYKDILANLPNGNVCCLLDENGQSYSYVGRDISQSKQPPIMYAAWGDQEAHGCNLNQLSQLNNFCGVELPVAVNNYNVECQYS